MDISSLTQVTSSVSSVGSSQAGTISSRPAQVTPQTSVTSDAKALKRAPNRDEKIESTKVEISAVGQAQGALAELQAASQAVFEPRQTATADTAKRSVENFVNAYNKANTTVGNVAKINSQQASALGNETRTELRRAVSDVNSANELKKAGITQDQGGALSLDTKVLDKALSERPEQTIAVVAEAGRKVEKSAAQGLAATRKSDGSAPNIGAAYIESRGGEQQAQTEASKRAAVQPAANPNPTSGIAAYQRSFLG